MLDMHVLIYSTFHPPPFSRGSYPPVSSRYSRELKDLIDSCLRSQPRQRPSINGILRLPFIQKRIESFLSESVSILFKKKLNLHHDSARLLGPATNCSQFLSTATKIVIATHTICHHLNNSGHNLISFHVAPTHL